MPAPTVVLDKPQPSSPGPREAVQRAAANRAQPQRFWNRASNRMETAQQMHAYRAPVPAGHNVSKTTQTVTRQVTPQPRQPVSFINKSPAEIEATARQLVQTELGANRVPFQQQTALLGQEQQGALASHAASYGQLASTVGGLQTAQAGQAKTFENYAADAISKAATAAPGAQQTAERLGLKPGEQLPESARNQQEAARTLLSGIAQAGQAGTNARQQSEANFLTNTQAAVGQANVEGAKGIEGAFGRQKETVANQQAAMEAKGQGAYGKTLQSMLGEQAKLRTAQNIAAGKQLDYETKAAATTSKIKTEAGKLQNEGAKINISAANANSLANYRKATAGQKERLDNANIADKAAKIKVAIEKNQKTGAAKPLTTVQVTKLSTELGSAFQTIERMREKGVPYNQIRTMLTSGQGRYHEVEGAKGGKPKAALEKVSRVANQTLIDAAEQIYIYHYLNPQTSAALEAMGLPGSKNEWSKQLIRRH